MKIYFLTSIIVLFFSCTSSKESTIQKKIDLSEQEIIVPEFQSIIDSANVTGSILIFDIEENIYYSNDFEYSKKGKIPASTFKIPNTIIALETNIMENDSTIIKWNGEKRWNKNWEQDLTFREAFHFSCVPCYQEIARKIGVKRMTEYLEKLEYEDMKVDSTNIDYFWLKGESRINQFQQIDFLKRLDQSQLSISERTETIMKRIFVIETNDQYTLRGKTGLSIENEIYNGWFVGYFQFENKTYYFATNAEPIEEIEMNLFSKIRKEVTYKAFEQMGLLNNNEY